MAPAVTDNSATFIAQSKWNPSIYPYPNKYNDHFVTPVAAYEELAPILAYLLMRRHAAGNKSLRPSEAVCYDPYYCDGAPVQRLKDVLQRASTRASGGASGWSVINEMRDFYIDAASGTCPPHDYLVTNPPYSGDHKERCLKFAVSNAGRPWALLMPGYVANKQYFRMLSGGGEDPVPGIFYVVPSRPYHYSHPEGTGHDDPPFDSLWFVGLGSEADQDIGLRKFFSEWFQDLPVEERPVLAGSVRELRAMGRLRQEEEERGRGNPRMRKKRKKKREGGGGANTKETEVGEGSRRRDGSKTKAEAKKIVPKEKGLDNRTFFKGRIKFLR